MPKRKKRVKLPNGYGQISYLGKGRRNPYAVYPPAKDYYEHTGQMKHPKALCYVNDYMIAFAILSAYHQGNYKEGMELELMKNPDSVDTYVSEKRINVGMTFAGLYAEFYKWKFEGKREYSPSTICLSNAAFNNCSVFHDAPIKSIKYNQLQEFLDGIKLSRASVAAVHLLLKQAFKYAAVQGYVEINPTELLKINHADETEHGIPFTNDDLKKIYAHKDDDIANLLMCLCFTGHRINEYRVVDIDLKNGTIKGGLKNRTSKERIVPIHSVATELLSTRIAKHGNLLKHSYQTYSAKLDPYLKSIGIMEKHTFHDCRHTFSKLCEDFGVRENDRKRLLGHTIGDITNDVYGHRDIEALRTEIEKIKPDLN